MEFFIDNLSGDKVPFECDRFTERAQNGQRVSVRSPEGAPDDRGVGNVLADKRGDVFGFMPGVCAVRPGLLSVRRADRDVKGSVGVAEGRG